MKVDPLSQLFLEEEAVQRAISSVSIRIALEWTKKGAVAYASLRQQIIHIDLPFPQVDPVESFYNIFGIVLLCLGVQGNSKVVDCQYRASLSCRLVHIHSQV